MRFKIDYVVQDLTKPDQTRTVHFGILDAEDGANLGRIIMEIHRKGTTSHGPSHIVEVITTCMATLVS